MSDSPTSTLTLLKWSPTFSTIHEDYQRLQSSTSTTDNVRSALFRDSEPSDSARVDVGDVDVDMDAGAVPSPLSDTELSNMLNLEGIEWAVGLTNIGRPTSPTHPIIDANDGSGSPSGFIDSDQISRSPSGFPTGRLLPCIYFKLRDAGTRFWAAVAVDIQHCTWAELSQVLCGRQPTKTQFQKVFSDALARQTAFSPTWRAVKVTLDVPLLVNTEASRSKDAMIEQALQIKGPIQLVEAEVFTTPTDTKFLLALTLTFAAEWAHYRSHCYGKAAFIVLPPTVPGGSGLLPEVHKFTPAFRKKLGQLLDDHSTGCGLLHEQPFSDSDVLTLPASSAPAPGPQFVWFGNSALKDAIHRALYDPMYPGWFGFLEDVKMADGSRFWAPLSDASPKQAGQVLGWIEELLHFHILQGNKARKPLTAYAQPPDNPGLTAHDSVIKKFNRHARFLSLVSGGTGEILEEDDPYTALLAEESEARVACVDAYSEFIKRPAYLPYHVSVAQYRG